MWNDRLRIAECVLPQWKALSEDEKSRVRGALQLIDDDPIIGAPLFAPLRGYWSLRVDHLRLVYRIVSEARFIVILAMGRADEKRTP